VLLGDLRGQILLALEQSGDIALEFNHLAGNGFGRVRADEASGHCPGENRGTENENITNTHGQSS
jgi:hypothetical protein